MCFFDKFRDLCKNRGVTETRALIEAGLSKSLKTKWEYKPDTIPNGATLKKLSTYFGVPIDYFLDENEKQPIITEDDELSEILEACRERSELRMLFKLSAGATAEDVKQAIKIIEALRAND